MGDNTQVAHTPSPEQELSQDRTGSSHSHSRRSLSRSMATGAPSRDSPVNSTLVQQQANALSSPPILSTPSEFHDVKFPHPYDQRRTSVIPDLQYPNVAPENDSWPSFDEEQPAPRDSASVPPLHQPSMPRNSSVPGSGGGLSNGFTDDPASPSSSTLPQRSRSLAPTEPEQFRRLVEHLIKLASVREERMSRQREIFGLRSGELSAFSSDAARATKSVQDQVEHLKLQAEEMRAQAGQMLQEANKTRELADRFITSVETLNVDVPNARTHVDHLVERSEQMTSFMRKTFDWLATLRSRELEKADAIQAEFAEQALAEINRLVRMQELQRQLERRREEAREKEEAAKREQEEREAAKKAEEEAEAARKEAYEAQRAAVMAQKRRANEEHAQSIQAERERRLADVSASGPSGSTGPSTVFPGVASEHIDNARVTTSLSSPPFTNGPSHSPARGKGPLEIAAPLPQLPPSPNKAKTAPAPVFFVPAQTEVGRTVKTDSPLSSTTLASELHPRIVQSSHPPPLNHRMYAPAQDQMLRPEPRRTTPKSELRPVDIKREPSVEVLPATRLQASPSQSSAVMDEGRQRHLAIPQKTPSQEGNRDLHNQTSSRPPSRLGSPYVTQTEDHRRSDHSIPVPPEQASSTHSRDSLRGRADQGTDVRGYTRQDSTSSNRSPPRWNDHDRRSRSPLPRRPLSRSPSPYARKRVRSGTPSYDSRQAPDHWKSQQRSPWRSRPDWADRDRGRDRDRQSHDYDRERQGDSPRRYRPQPPRRIDTYRPPSHSPAPPSPRQYRYERPSPRPGHHERSPSYDTQRFVGSDAQDRQSERFNSNARYFEQTSEAEVRHPAGREEQQRYQRRTPSPSDRDRTPTPPPRLAEAEVGLLDRINMNEAEYRGRGRGRLPPGGVARGGPNPRRGIRGAPSSGRGRGVASGSTPALLTRMNGTTPRGGIRPAHAPSLSDRMQQD
jgi:hypothetical protein